MERRQLTLMFTDIVGYSQLMGKNEHQTIGLVDEYRRILLSRIQEFNGRVIEFIGDAVFASFDIPLDAVNAGMAIQDDLQRFNEHAQGDTPPLRTRIGIHSGEVTLKEGAPFGDDVNIAARLEPLAVADGICISEPVYQSIKPEINAPIKALGVRPLKNIESKLRAYLIRPKGITYSTHLHYAVRTFQQKIEAYRYPLAIALVCIIAAGFYLVPRWLVPGYTANYVEIADFKNLMSEGQEADYFSAGITEALRSQLADMEDVYILDPSKGVRGPVRLEGSVQKIGESLRIAYRLFRRKDNVQIAGGKLDGAYDDIFILQDRVVAEVGRYLAKEFDLKFFRPAALNLTSDVTAYDYYLKGMEYLRMPEMHENFDSAIKYFSTALVHDEGFSLANAGICQSYRWKYNLTKDTHLLKKGQEYCYLALMQDETQDYVYLALSSIASAQGDFVGAEDYLNKALNIDKNNLEALVFLGRAYQALNKLDKAEKLLVSVIGQHPGYWKAYVEYSYLLISQGRMDESISILKDVLVLTPENEPALSNLGSANLYRGDFSKSAQIFKKATSVVPSATSYSNLAVSYYYSRDYLKSVLALERAIKISPEDYRLYINLADVLRLVPSKEGEVKKYCRMGIKLISENYPESEYPIDANQYLAVGYFHLGKREKAKRYAAIARELEPYNIDVMYTSLRIWALLGQHDKAMKALKNIVGLGYPTALLKAEPDLDSLKDFPDYKDLIG